MMRIYASDEYFEGQGDGYVSYDAQEATLRATFRRFLRDLAGRGVKGGSILEIGCGYGYFLDEAGQMFEKRAGTDFSAAAVARARELTGADIRQGGVEAFEERPEFDLGVAIEVLEHVYRPTHFLATLRKRIRPGGHVFIVVPNAGSLWRRVMGQAWPSWKLPEHISHFTPTSLTRTLKRAGFIRPQRIAGSHAYPAGLIASKLGVSLSDSLGSRPIWLPGVVIGMLAKKPE